MRLPTPTFQGPSAGYWCRGSLSTRLTIYLSSGSSVRGTKTLIGSTLIVTQMGRLRLLPPEPVWAPASERVRPWPRHQVDDPRRSSFTTSYPYSTVARRIRTTVGAWHTIVPPLIDEKGRFGVLVIKTVSGAEIRIPLRDLDSITEIEPVSGEVRDVQPHPYLHREGVNRCAPCWRPRIDSSHTDQAVHN
ncbi:MAG: hypothetical protein QOI08_1495 [Actinomycetota bacterium]|nr:hypothetical protein [Actinomycetota bacterium]